jgi:hypothetical membrane protein
LSARTAGTLLFIGSVQFIIAMVIAEAIYPGYSVSSNYISDLGVGPAAGIFNSSVALLGLTGLLAAHFVQRASRKPVISALLGIAGAGAFGVGVFPETAGLIHPVVSLVTFLFGGLSAIATYKLEKPPLNYLSVAFGVFSLTALLLYGGGTFLGLGRGGMERMVAYPILLWAVSFGTQLLTTS